MAIREIEKTWAVTDDERNEIAQVVANSLTGTVHLQPTQGKYLAATHRDINSVIEALTAARDWLNN
jgi:hypothetical protein